MKKIVFSLTVHESLECFVDLINNVKFYTTDFNILILVSATNSIKEQYSKLESKIENVIIVSNRSDTLKFHGRIDIFWAHMLNVKYLIDNNIEFDYFYFLASNEMIIKKITNEYIEKNIIKIISKKLETDFDEKSYNENIQWMVENKHIRGRVFNGYVKILENPYVFEKFKKYKLGFSHMPHESTILPNFLIIEIYNAYVEYDINSSPYRIGYIEEIFIPCYLSLKYNYESYRNFCLRYNFTEYNKMNPIDIYNMIKNDDRYLSIKPIPRIYDDKTRVYIRNDMK